jgi:hypothetical protein
MAEEQSRISYVSTQLPSPINGTETYLQAVLAELQLINQYLKTQIMIIEKLVKAIEILEKTSKVKK